MKQQIEQVQQYLQALQNSLCATLAMTDSRQSFITEKWQYQQGKGGGISKVLTKGAVFEQAGVNFSYVKGDKLPEAATATRPELKDCAFQALGVSVVVHPQNPYVPTAHMNVRLFVAEGKDAAPIWWFGGGFDLTPYYGFEEDAIHWHQTASDLCQPFGKDVYRQYKKWCDQYFYLKHRDEQRGVGGLFFDDLNEWDFDNCFAFIKAVAEGFSKAYMPIVERRQSMFYGERERQFQLYRRGRYVEFNLLYDRGTIFGLQSGGRTESILMSLPPLVRWQYQHQLEKGSSEEKLHRYFLKAKEWL